jgi:hypothetical protein
LDQIVLVVKLLSGLELWFTDEGKAYTVPSRSEAADIQETVVEVDSWLQNDRQSSIPSEEQLARRHRAVECWLDRFEDQYAYLSRAMPERQKREVSRESISPLAIKEMMARIDANLKLKEN